MCLLNFPALLTVTSLLLHCQLLLLQKRTDRLLWGGGERRGLSGVQGLLFPLNLK
jgi:hypothetical protein